MYLRNTRVVEIRYLGVDGVHNNPSERSDTVPSLLESYPRLF